MLTSYSDVNCMVSMIKPSSPEAAPAAGVWSLSFRPDQDTGFLFPYINGAMDDALWYERPEHVRFLFEGYRCVLYPERAAVHFFDSREKALGFIRRFMDLLKNIDEKRKHIPPNFNQIRQIPVMDIYKLLPGTNCRVCGFSTCMAFAAAVTRGKAVADQCPGLAAPMSENAVYPVFDRQGELVHSVSLNIDTSGLKQRIQDQEARIRMLESRLPPLPADETDRAAWGGPTLTDREIEVLALIARGNTNNEIGNHLFISPHTVKSHMINIFNKLNVSDRTQAAVQGVRRGLI